MPGDVADDEHDEARFVSDEIDKLVDGGKRAADVAVFYRTNAQSRVFEEIFIRSLTVHGFTVGTGPSASILPKFYEVVTPLVVAGKITTREHRFSLKEAGEALASVHFGTNVGKAVIVVSEDA